MHHEFASVTVAGVAKALAEFGWYDAVVAQVAAPTREALERPQHHKYHPGATLDEVMDVAYRLHGGEGPERII